jgi:uncharacterized cupredoxin-like copper-binding protein
MIRTRFILLPLAVVALAVPLAGCGDDDDEDEGATEAATTEATQTGGGGGAGGTVNLSGTEFKFTPSDPTAKSGEVTFNLTNDGSTTHSLEVEGPDEEQELESELQPGQSGSLTINLPPGTYEFYCPVDDHKGQGMEGEITVQ